MADSVKADVQRHGLLVHPNVASAVCAGVQHHVPMPFQCRALEKNSGRFLLLLAPPEAHAPQQLRALCLLSFVANRRFDDDKMIVLGSAAGSTLPSSDAGLASMRRGLGDKKTRKTTVCWEVEVRRVYPEPVILSGPVTAVDSASLHVDFGQDCLLQTAWIHCP